MIICTRCTCVFGGRGGWLGALMAGWVYKKVKGIEHVFCPTCKDTEIEGE